MFNKSVQRSVKKEKDSISKHMKVTLSTSFSKIEKEEISLL